MADPTMREVLDELATLRDTVRRQEVALARQRRRRRQLLPLVLAALLVALVPLATLAAGPFTDLVPGSPHNGDIELLYAAGITKGCGPARFCPEDFVTRQEMASFLARVVGLGGNPPIVNALSVQAEVGASGPSRGTIVAYLRASGSDGQSVPAEGTVAYLSGTTIRATAGPDGKVVLNGVPAGVWAVQMAMKKEMTTMLPEGPPLKSVYRCAGVIPGIEVAGGQTAEVPGYVQSDLICQPIAPR